MLRTITRLVVLMSAIVSLLAVPAGAEEAYVVIVNADNPVSEISASDLSKLFLKKKASWDGGGDVEPVDLTADDPARTAFSQSVHGRSVQAIKTYWQKQIFAGRDLPPAEASAGDVLAVVSSTTGAISYVPTSTELPASVKPVTIIG